MECSICPTIRYTLLLLIAILVFAGCRRGPTLAEQQLACEISILELEVSTLRLENKFLKQEVQFCEYSLDYVLSGAFEDSLIQDAAVLKQMAMYMQETNGWSNSPNIGGP